MYAENWSEFIKTMQGVFIGIRELAKDYNQIVSEKDFLNHVTVILIADGYNNINEEFKTNAEKLNIFRREAISSFMKTTNKKE